MSSFSDFLSAETMRRLDRLMLGSRWTAEGGRAGRHSSVLKGASVEFRDHRDYVQGDSLRHLDWKVFGRSERYYIKQFQEETSLRVHLVLDASASMDFKHSGKTTKYRLRARARRRRGLSRIPPAGLRRTCDLRRRGPQLAASLRRVAPCPAFPRSAQLPRARWKNRYRQGSRSARRRHGPPRAGADDVRSARRAGCGLPRACALPPPRARRACSSRCSIPLNSTCHSTAASDFIDMETGERLEADVALVRRSYQESVRRGHRRLPRTLRFTACRFPHRHHRPQPVGFSQ